MHWFSEEFGLTSVGWESESGSRDQKLKTTKVEISFTGIDIRKRHQQGRK